MTMLNMLLPLLIMDTKPTPASTKPGSKASGLSRAECPQAVCFDFVYGWRHFGRLVVLVVCINTCIQMAIYGPEPDSWYRAQNAIDAIFVALYTIELVLKIGAEKNLRCGFNVMHGPSCSVRLERPLADSKLQLCWCDRMWAKNRWNVAEAVLLIGSLATVFPARGTAREVSFTRLTG